MRLWHTKVNALDNLRRQVDSGIVLGKAVLPVPSQRLRLYGYRPETSWGTPELFLLRKCFVNVLHV